MDETRVQLLCPDCQKDWQRSPRDLPGPSIAYECPACGSSRPTAEFTRTDRDLRTLKQFG
ncbi:MAG: hypothetical protein U5K37_04645 [Natrialbaceae archaeon]|nr:hypothetical protein [Natrialbaceae archaeon]